MAFRDRETGLAYYKWYYYQNKERILKEGKERRAKYSEERRKADNKRIRENRRNKKGRFQYESEWNQMYRLNAKLAVIMIMGGKCACCGEEEAEFLTIDHVNNDGAEDRRKGRTGSFLKVRREGFPMDKYQLLCFNCNSSKSFGKGKCIHQRKKEEENAKGMDRPIQI